MQCTQIADPCLQLWCVSVHYVRHHHVTEPTSPSRCPFPPLFYAYAKCLLILSNPSAYTVLVLNQAQRNKGMLSEELSEGMAKEKLSSAIVAALGTWNPAGICMEQIHFFFFFFSFLSPKKGGTSRLFKTNKQTNQRPMTHNTILQKKAGCLPFKYIFKSGNWLVCVCVRA